MNKSQKEKRQRRFADIIITVCVTMGVLLAGAVVYEYHRLDTPLPSGVLGTLYGFFGGELLIICLRQVFGSDVVKQAKSSKSTEEGNYP